MRAVFKRVGSTLQLYLHLTYHLLEEMFVVRALNKDWLIRRSGVVELPFPAIDFRNLLSYDPTRIGLLAVSMVSRADLREKRQG